MHVHPNRSKALWRFVIPPGKLAADMERLPNFYILGASKSGTTTLFYALQPHPDVHLSTPKEPLFFEMEYEKGPGYYWQNYFAPGYGGESCVGDARTAHLFLPYVAARIHALTPGARLVAVLRDPVSRAFSHWWARRCFGHEPLDFDSALRANRESMAARLSVESDDAEALWCESQEPVAGHPGIYMPRMRTYIEVGHYAQQLERYLEYFPREQLLVVFFDDLVRDPAGTMRRVFEFLDLDPIGTDAAPARENVALTAFSRPLFALSNRLRLQRVLPRKVLSTLREQLSRIGSRPTPSDAAREWLVDHYAPHNRRLRKLLGNLPAGWPD